MVDLKNLRSKMEDDLRNLDKQRGSIIDEIQEFKNQIIAKVEELERESLRKVKSKHKELADNMNAYSKKIDELLEVIDIRLNKLTTTKDKSVAQQFVDVKNGEKEACQGADLVKQAPSRNKKNMTFEMNTDIKVRLSKEQSLGSLKEWPIMNIVCAVETEITKAFVSELQENMKTYEIESENTGLTGIIAGPYTIVVCEDDTKAKAVEGTAGIQDNTIIMMTLYDMNSYWNPSNRFRQKKFKLDLRISYEIDEYVPHTISFGNIQTYKDVSNIVKDLSNSN